VVLGGHGEPTLHPRFDDLLDLVAGLGMVPYVLTNGLAVDLARAGEWASRRAHYRFSVHAGDLDTWLRVHPRGSGEQFERLEGVLGCLAASDWAQVSTMHVLQKANFRDARRMVEHAGSLGIREVQFFPVRTSDELAEVLLGREDEAELRGELRACERLAATYGIRTNLREYLGNNRYTRTGVPATAALYRHVPCYVGWLYAEFDVDGSMRPCENSTILLGRAGEQSVREMWNSPRYDAFRREGRTMPRRGTPVAGCPCDACCMPKFNTNVHNLLRLRSLRYGEA
jgi:MoaA/NifB/PqqE/SkfB family radical SAM enzyme